MELIEKYFLLFIIYSFAGWCMETTHVSIHSKKFINRGFLLGPYCPIYGVGSLFIVTILDKISFDNPIILFFVVVIACGLLEYITSWAMEIIFKARWWDYSKRKFNINGRVCLFNLVAFGVLGLAVEYILQPFFCDLINRLNSEQLKDITIGLAIIYIADSIISFTVIFGFRKVTQNVNAENKQDNTEQITKMVRDLVSQKSFIHRRFINAYPKLEAIKIRIKEIRGKIEDATIEAKDAVNEKKEQLKIKIEDATNVAKDVVNTKKEEYKLSKRKFKINLYLGKKYLKHKFIGNITKNKNLRKEK